MPPSSTHFLQAVWRPCTPSSSARCKARQTLSCQRLDCLSAQKRYLVSDRRQTEQTPGFVTYCASRPLAQEFNRSPSGPHSSSSSNSRFMIRCLRSTHSLRILRASQSKNRDARIYTTDALDSLTRTQPDPSALGQRCFSTSPGSFTPDSTVPRQPLALSIEQYHELADAYLDALVERLEVDLQEVRSDVDVEYSAGVLTLRLPPNGTYVLNKQPPNRQIWLSSPLSGPKRYDYVASAPDSSVSLSPDDGPRGRWEYLRDGSSLTDLLHEELKLDVSELAAIEAGDQ